MLYIYCIAQQRGSDEEIARKRDGARFLLNQELAKLKASLDSDDALQTNTTVFDGRRVTPQQIIATCDALPFFSSHRLVIVEGLVQHSGSGERGRRSRKKAEAAVQEDGAGQWRALVEYIDRMPETTTLVLIEEKPGQGALWEGLASKAQLRQFNFPPRPLPDWIRERAKQLGLSFDRGSTALLADLVGPDPWALEAELRKLASYTMGKPVREADVRAIVSQARDVQVFDVIDAIVEGKGDLALRLVKQFLGEGHDPGQVRGMLERQYRLLAIAREMLDSGAGSGKIGGRLGLPQFAAERLVDQAAQYSWARIRAAFHLMAESEAAAFTGVYDKDVALDLLIRDLAALAGRSRRTSGLARTR